MLPTPSDHASHRKIFDSNQAGLTATQLDHILGADDGSFNNATELLKKSFES